MSDWQNNVVEAAALAASQAACKATRMPLCAARQGMKLSGKKLGELCEIQLSAITDEQNLARIFSEMDIRLQAVVRPGTLTDAADQLLNYLESRRVLEKFLDALARERSNLTDSLKVFRDIATTPSKGLESVGGWAAEQHLACAGVVGAVLALIVAGLVLSWPRDQLAVGDTCPPRGTGDRKDEPQDTSEPLTPIHAPEMWKNSFVICGERVVYAFPDTTYEVLEDRLNKTENSILNNVKIEKLAA